MAVYRVVDVLEQVSKEPDHTRKLAFLKQNESVELRTMLKFGFDPNLEVYYVPEGDIPQDELSETKHVSFENVWKSLPAFTSKPGTGVSENKIRMQRQRAWVNLTSNMRDRDRYWLVTAKDKRLSEKLGLTQNDIHEVFPATVPAEVVEEVARPTNAQENSGDGLLNLTASTELTEKPNAEEKPKKRGRGRPKGSKNRK